MMHTYGETHSPLAMTWDYSSAAATPISPNITNSSSAGNNAPEAMGYVYFYLTGITSILSMIGCSVLVLTYFLFRELRSTGRKLLVCLSVADFLTAVGNFIGIFWYLQMNHEATAEASFICQFHASLTIFSSISSFLWTSCIGLHLFVCICLLDVRKADKMFWPFSLICWVLPAIIGIVSWSLSVLGHDPSAKGPSWCWIRPNVTLLTPLFWQYMTGKAWEIACYFITAIIYAFITKTLHQQISNRARLQPTSSPAVKRQNKSIIAEANRKLIFVPIIFVALRIWGTIRFLVGEHFLDESGNGLDWSWIVPLQGVGDSAQGFTSFILFCCLSPRVRHLCLHSCVGCDCKVLPHPLTPASPRSPGIKLTNSASPVDNKTGNKVIIPPANQITPIADHL